jgi:hypothetical protein
MPNALTDTLAVFAYNTNRLPAFIIKPVLSRTPDAPTCTSYSINSAVVGVVPAASAILTVAVVVPLFKTVH